MPPMIFMSELFDSFYDILSLLDYHTYTEQLQLQEAASLQASTSHASTSYSQIICCEICTEEKEIPDMFRIIGCPHLFCSLCLSKHVEYKLQENIIPISCPDQDCNNIIDPNSLGSIISPHVQNRWEEAIIESTIIFGCKKVHCPYEECSEVLISDFGEGVVFEECECPSCHRLFCAKCKVPWHHGFDCKEFVRSNKNKEEKEKLKLLARENNWRKCPNCKVFVDKTEGCIHITCRCKFEFCYTCGSLWNDGHWHSCQH